ncbi:MAG: exosortase system-associated protein, TIGR04073 family [Candidatus Omnitrophica bacterium]|nr:exosortase system-associated protein, TIGR04073 family [Candidatus Omnitrophota bacterium]
MKKQTTIMFLVFVMLMWGIAPYALAGEATTGDLVTDSGIKLGRGLVNIVSSVAEIPCGIGNEMEGGPWYGFFTGLGKGTVYMVRRILVGACEVGTFVIPMDATLPPVCQMD